MGKYNSFFVNPIFMFVLVVILLSKCDSSDYFDTEFVNSLRSLNEVQLIKQIATNAIKQDNGNNADCIDDLMLFLNSYNSSRWAMEMLDAVGRSPSGILKGNLYNLGQFGECIEINHMREDTERSIRGKYCLGQLKSLPNETVNIVDILGLEKTAVIAAYEQTMNLAICMPSSCTTLIMETILQDILDPRNLTMSLPVKRCSVDEPRPWRGEQIFGVVFFSLFALFLIVSTCHDLWITFSKKGDRRSANPILIAFSLYTNSKRLTSLSNDPGPLACLHGIRVLSICWIIMGHRYLRSLTFGVNNVIDAMNWTQTYQAMIILGSTVAVDSFFLMSGILLSYIFFRETKSKSPSQIPFHYLHRYLRLTPVLAVMILFIVAFVPRIGSGPLWEINMDSVVDPCKKYWWSALLYVQNYVNPEDVCMNQTWYLSPDMHLYLLSPLILFPILWKPKVGLSLLGVWIVASLTTVFVIAYVNAWKAAGLSLNDPNASTRQYKFYVPTHTRATPWLIGVFAGYFLRHNVGKAVKFNRFLVLIGWLASFTVMGAVTFGLQPLQSLDHEFNHLQDTTYLAFSRTSWTLALLWIIYACVYGYGGPINWLLSLRMWEFLARLSYSMYLVHVVIQYLSISSSTTIPSFSHLYIAQLYIADLLATTVISFFMVLAFESPITVLQKMLLRTERNGPSRVKS